MASNLNEYYQSIGQTLPSVSDRTGTATKAGITGYTGTAEQNASLLGYLQKTPNQSGNNVMTSDNLTPEKPIETKPVVPDTSSAGISGGISSLVDTTKANITKEEADYQAKSSDYAKALKDFGDQGTFQEQVYKDQGVDTSKKIRDNFLSQIEQEQKSTADRLDQIRKTFNGTTGGANAEMERVQRESANRLANYGIGLSAASRDYETASSIATRLIQSNTDKLKADIESRQFVLGQLGTKLATEKSNAFNLQLKQIDKEDNYLKDAIKTATDGAKDGTIDGGTAFDAVKDLTSGKISISQFYTKLGVNNTLGNVNGYDITSYATDPEHEVKVQSIFDTLGEIKNDEDATSTIKHLAPNSPITGTMIMNSANKYHVDPKVMISLMQQDSSLGTAGLGKKTNNPGNVGNDDAGNIQKFDTVADGVDAVAKWLNNHRSKGIYRGEFEGTLDTVVNAVNGVPEVTRKAQLANLKKYIANGDYPTAYTQIVNTVANSLPAEQKTQFVAKRDALPSIDALTSKLQAYTAAGGSTGILKGKYEDIAGKLGQVQDQKFKALATDLKIALQQYRHDLSGSAFSTQEASDYASVNPAGSNSLDLNLSLLQGMKDNFKRTVDSTVDGVAGDGAKYIREYAETGRTPQTSNTPAASYSTPSGNSFTIISN